MLMVSFRVLNSMRNADSSSLGSQRVIRSSTCKRTSMLPTGCLLDLHTQTLQVKTSSSKKANIEFRTRHPECCVFERDLVGRYHWRKTLRVAFPYGNTQGALRRRSSQLSRKARDEPSLANRRTLESLPTRSKSFRGTVYELRPSDTFARDEKATTSRTRSE